MFRKLVANLSFSPSLVGEISAYATRLKHEQRRRALGLLVLLMALVIQCVIALYPPESSNQANDNDIVYGGISSSTKLLEEYDANTRNIRDIYNSFGITRAELQHIKPHVVNSQQFQYVTGRESLVSRADGEQTYRYAKQSGGTGTIYIRPSSQYDHSRYATSHGSTYDALRGTSSKVGDFAVLVHSGNIALTKLPSPLSENSEKCSQDSSRAVSTTPCKPCPSNPQLAVTAPTCTQPIVSTLSAFNNTQLQPASATQARASDRISYTIQAKNIGDTNIDFTISNRLADVLEYADLLDAGGAMLDAETHTLSWPSVTLAPQQTISKHFSVRVSSHLPVTNRGLSNPASYDCLMTNTVGNSLSIGVTCPVVKSVEAVASQLPTTPAPVALLGMSAITAVALILYLRTRLYREEIRLIRHDLNTGVLS